MVFDRVNARLRRVPSDHWSQVIVWLATSAIFPIVVFFGYVIAGDTLQSQIGRGQLLLVAGALTAPIVGVLVTLPGPRTLGRSFLFAAAFVHVVVTVFYFAPVSDTSRSPKHVAGNSVALYVFAVVVGAMTVLVTANAVDRESSRRVVEALRRRGYRGNRP